ncbi:MAG: hypothetical protein DRQ46_00180 [Gammaproteobacteria bacterium]|nr:MAG: hypothetical protein DRQ46_00180 [Gammaproteobacteria bacterium]
MIIDTYDLTILNDRIAEIAWNGSVGKVAYVFLNGLSIFGPLQFGDVTARTVIVNLANLYAIEIHEANEDEVVNSKYLPLIRRPWFYWSSITTANFYRIYLDDIWIQSHDADDELPLFKAQSAKNLIDDDGYQGIFNIEAVTNEGKESAGDAWSFFIEGLPPIPTDASLSGTSPNLTLTISI